MSSVDLFTIGYQGRTLDDFLATLVGNDIEVLADVRYTPWSYKTAFCRRQLASELESHNVRYVHLPQFGTSPTLRRALRETGDWQGFAGAYREHLDTLNGDFERALADYHGKRLCLLCMETDPAYCHRSILADEMRNRGLASSPFHL